VTERDPGFYWISLTGASEIGLWDGNEWFVVGSAMTVPDEEVEVLGPKLEPPVRSA
jgi:hypothetical protein